MDDNKIMLPWWQKFDFRLEISILLEYKVYEIKTHKDVVSNGFNKSNIFVYFRSVGTLSVNS